MRTKLTQKQEDFCLHYIQCGNATEAAKLAKYSPKTAQEIGSENLLKPMISDRISELRKKTESDAILSAEECQTILSQIAKANLLDYQEAGADGSYLSIGKESPNTTAIREITSVTKYDQSGNAPSLITNIKLNDKVRAIEALAKLRGWTKDAPLAVGNLTINVVSRIPRPAYQALPEGVTNTAKPEIATSENTENN